MKNRFSLLCSAALLLASSVCAQTGSADGHVCTSFQQWGMV